MPILAGKLIEGHGDVISVKGNQTLLEAYRLMIKHDYSQLPVIDDDNKASNIVTYESMLHGIQSFHTGIENLLVRDFLISIPCFHPQDKLSTVLDQLKRCSAVLVVDKEDHLVGIITSYDTTEFFHKYAKNIMQVEVIEQTVKDFIASLYVDSQGHLDYERLTPLIARVCDSQGQYANRSRKFKDLTLSDYTHLLLVDDIWKKIETTMAIPKLSLRSLLGDVVNIRNCLAHFRNDEITAEQEMLLQCCSEWLSNRKADWDETRRSLPPESRRTANGFENGRLAENPIASASG